MGSIENRELELVPLLINGKPATSSPSITFPVFGLEQHKLVFLAESADPDTARRAADASWLTFQSWKGTPAVSRRKILLRYAELLRQHEDELVTAQREETSVIEIWARKNVHLAADLIEEVGACITRLHGEIPQTQTPSGLALAFVVPMGPVLSIAPWNSSVILGARAIATPVAAGCTVVFKASEYCPKTHNLLVKLFELAGLPPGVVNVIQTRREDAALVTEALIAHPAITKIEFIGSASVGQAIGELAGRHLKPVLMELGGKGPVIVLADADLQDAAKKCVAGAFLHHGQLCFSTEKVIVLEPVAARFQDLLVEEAINFETGSGVSQRILDSSLEKLRDAKEKGACFLIGGPELASSVSLKPTILAGVTKEMSIYDEEAFGPSFSVFIAKNDREAIEMANATKYGLNAAVHSKDMKHALDVAREIDSGSIHVNSMTAHDEPTLPVGGIRGSGWGRNNALWGLKEFTEIKLVTFSNGHKFV